MKTLACQGTRDILGAGEASETKRDHSRHLGNHERGFTAIDACIYGYGRRDGHS